MSTALDAAADFDAFIDIDGSGAPDSPLPQPAGDTPKLLSRTAAGRPQHGRRPTPLSMSALPAHLTAGSDAHSPAFHGNGMASPMNAPSSPSVGDMFTFASAAGTPTTHSASLHSLSFDFFDGAALPGSVPFAGAPAHLSREGAADAHARQPAGPVQEVYAASYEHVPSPLAWNVSNTAATPEQHRAASAFSAAAANRAAGRGAEAVHAGAENEQLAFGAPYASPNKMLDPNGYGMPFMPFSQHDASMGMHGVGPFQQHHNYAAFAHGPPQGHAVPGAAHPSFAGGDEGPSPFTEDRSSPGSSTAPTSTERHSPPPPEKRRRLTVSDAPPPQQPVHDEESTAKALAAAVAAAAPAPPAKKAARKASKRKTKAEKNAEAAAAKAAADEAPAKRDSIVSIEASAAASNAGDAASEAANGDRDDVESVTSASQSGKRAPPSASHVTENGQPFPVIDTSAKHSSLFVPPDTSGLTKREARLVKNRAAAFLSRQRKREQFEELESRCRAICRLVWRMWEVVAGPDMSWDMFGQTILPQLLQDEAPEVREALEMIVAGKGASIAPTEESIAQNSSSGGTQRSTVSPAKQTVKRERDEDFDDSFASVASSRAVHSSHGRNSSLSSSSGNSSASTACTSVNQDAQQEPQQHQPRDKSDASAKAAQQSAPPHSPHDERPFRSGASASETGVSLTLGPEPEGKQEGGAEGSGAAVLPAEGAGSAVQATAASAKMQRSSSGRGAMQRTASGLQKRSAGGMALMVMLFGFAFLGLPAGASSGGLERAPESRCVAARQCAMHTTPDTSAVAPSTWVPCWPRSHSRRRVPTACSAASAARTMRKKRRSHLNAPQPRLRSTSSLPPRTLLPLRTR
jgi:hypothetical protein